MSDGNERSKSESAALPASQAPRRERDYDRTLGVIECFTVIDEQCPSGAVRAVAQRALEAVRKGDAGVLREQAWYVLTAIQGWRGERAAQVHRSLSAFIESSKQTAR
jgi:hypothetical protein